MITEIPNESKYCVSYGQLNGVYWTIPATSTQGTTKEGDKDYIARVALSPNMDLALHKKVFSALCCKHFIKEKTDSLKQFQLFKTAISEIELPEKFTFPFYYTPHVLAEIATKESTSLLGDLKQTLPITSGSIQTLTENAIGKMFGVLVVKNNANQLGYSNVAFSGKLADESCPEIFVPPVFDLRTKHSFYKKGEEEINIINAKLTALKSDETYLFVKRVVKRASKKIEDDLALQRKKMAISKKERKLRKREAR